MPTTASVRVAIYLRISQDPTGEGLAVTRQREDCYRIARERGWSVVGEYTDNSKSAYDRNVRRPRYDDMVADFAAGKFEAIICWDLDRLTRQPRQLEDWIDAAQERGLKLVTANGEADLTGDAGQLFARIKAAVARGEMQRKSARQKRANLQRAQDGKSPGGIRLTGYSKDGMSVVDAEAELVRSLFMRFAHGESLTALAADLDRTGVPTRRGGSWSRTAVRSMLTNPRYAGRAAYRVGGVKVPQMVATGIWAPIVSESLFDTVGLMLTDPARVTNRVGMEKSHLGAGLYRCSVCEVPMASHTATGYRCLAGHMARTGAQIDAMVLRVVASYLATPDLASLLATPNEERARQLADELALLRERLAELEADYAAGFTKGAMFAKLTTATEALIRRNQLERAAISGNEVISGILAAGDPAKAFETAPLPVQRAVVDALAVVTLHPVGKGKRFTVESVSVRPTFG